MLSERRGGTTGWYDKDYRRFFSVHPLSFFPSFLSCFLSIHYIRINGSETSWCNAYALPENKEKKGLCKNVCSCDPGKQIIVFLEAERNGFEPRVWDNEQQEWIQISKMSTALRPTGRESPSVSQQPLGSRAPLEDPRARHLIISSAKSAGHVSRLVKTVRLGKRCGWDPRKTRVIAPRPCRERVDGRPDCVPIPALEYADLVAHRITISWRIRAPGKSFSPLKTPKTSNISLFPSLSFRPPSSWMILQTNWYG